MKAHPIAAAICIISGVFGGVCLAAFVEAFDPTVVAGREADDAEPGDRTRRFVNLVSAVTQGLGGGVSLGGYRRTRAETERKRFLVPLGMDLCALSCIGYREFSAWRCLRGT